MSIEFFFKLSILSELCLVCSSSKTMIVTIERLFQKVKVSNQNEFTKSKLKHALCTASPIQGLRNRKHVFDTNDVELEAYINK